MERITQSRGIGHRTNPSGPPLHANGTGLNALRGGSFETWTCCAACSPRPAAPPGWSSSKSSTWGSRTSRSATARWASSAESRTTDNHDDPDTSVDFISQNADRLTEIEMLRRPDLVQLPEGQSFARLDGGRLHKLRLPLAEDSPLPRGWPLPNHLRLDRPGRSQGSGGGPNTVSPFERNYAQLRAA